MNLEQKELLEIARQEYRDELRKIEAWWLAKYPLPSTDCGGVNYNMDKYRRVMGSCARTFPCRSGNKPVGHQANKQQEQEMALPTTIIGEI